MRRLTALLGFLLMILFLPAPAFASHGMVSLPDCSTYEMHLEDDYVKGRTDAVIFHVDHSVEVRPGCRDHAILSGVVPAGIGEAQGNRWQVGDDGKSGMCAQYGREYAVGLYRYAWDTEIDPSSVNVTCSPWRGRD